MAPEAQALADIVSKIIHTRRVETRISPSWVATEAILQIDPTKVSLPLVYLGCHLELRQIARGLLRLHFEDIADPSDDEQAQHEMFPHLQWRYPAERKKGADAEPEYVRLEELSKADIAFNVKRLRREGRAKLAHADALEAFGRGPKVSRAAS
jgi:hypothetical protein